MIDILLATYNGEAFLSQQLDSILNQDYSDWRLLVRDDVSSDNTYNILESYAKKNPDKIRIIGNNGINLGACQNFSELLRHAKSDYVMFCDQDDVWLPSKIELTSQKFIEMEALHGKETPLLVFTDATVVDEQLNILGPSLWSYQESDPNAAAHLNRVLLMTPANGCTMMINKALVHRALPVPQEAIMHDAWLILVAAAFGKVGFVPLPTLLYRQHGRNEAGSRAWGCQYIFMQLRSLAAAREAIARLQQQSSALLERYRAVLDSPTRDIVAAFAHLGQRGYFGRRIDIIRYGFFYIGFVRNVGWLLLC